jgi:hypothetical protein
VHFEWWVSFPGRAVARWITRLVGFILLLSYGLSLSSAGQAPTEPRTSAEKEGAKAFGPVLTRFSAGLNLLQPSELGEADHYNSSDVNLVLGRTAADILSQVPEGDLPLAAYVQRRLPAPVDPSRTFISKSEADTRFALLKELLSKLAALPAFLMNMMVVTRPPRAFFELKSAGGKHIETTTDDELTNVYRGEYEYTVSKQGYKSVHASIDLIDRAGSLLSCELLPEDDPQAALPCKLK